MVMIAWVVKLIELIELIEFIGLIEFIELAELFESNIQPNQLIQPFNLINHYLFPLLLSIQNLESQIRNQKIPPSSLVIRQSNICLHSMPYALCPMLFLSTFRLSNSEFHQIPTTSANSSSRNTDNG